MRSSLKKKILILGGSSDIGTNLIEKLDDRKFNIYLHYNKKKPKFIKQKVKLIKKNFAITKLINKNSELNRFKNFHIIVNLVGFIDNKTYFNSSHASLIKSLNANFLIPSIIYKNSIPFMKKNKFGRIINCTSIGVKFGGGENSYSYSLSKYSSEFISSEIRKLSKENILFNNLRVGFVNTKLHKKIKKKKINKRESLIPMKRAAKKEEIVEFINYLINHNTYITSQTINISGGE